jgi:hypothetical protein
VQARLREQRFDMTLRCTVGLLIGFCENLLISPELVSLLLHGESYSSFAVMDTAVAVVCELKWIVDKIRYGKVESWDSFYRTLRCVLS